MLFLADESCERAVVLALRDAGHDVTAVADLLPDASDQTVLGIATLEARILITKDKDFGELVFRFHAQSPGVILLRFPPAARASVPATVVKTVALLSTELSTSFTVLTPSGPRLARNTNLSISRHLGDGLQAVPLPLFWPGRAETNVARGTDRMLEWPMHQSTDS